MNEVQAAITGISVELSDSDIKPITDSHYIFRFSMHSKAVLSSTDTASNKPVGARVRVSGVLKDAVDRLRLIHYMEAGPTALPFIKKVYEEMAAA